MGARFTGRAVTVRSEKVKDFGDEQRIAFGCRVDRVDGIAFRRVGRCLLENLGDVFACQTGQRHAPALACDRGEDFVDCRTVRLIDGPRGADDEHRQAAQLAREELQQQERGLVAGMQIFEDEHERLVLGGVAQEGRRRVEELEAGLVGLDRRGRSIRVQAGTDLGNDLGDVGGTGAELLGELLGLEVAEIGAQCLHPGPVRRCAAAFPAAAPKHARPQDRRRAGKLVGKARLTDAGLADEHEEAAASAARFHEALAQLLQLCRAPDEGAPQGGDHTDIRLNSGTVIVSRKRPTCGPSRRSLLCRTSDEITC